MDPILLTASAYLILWGTVYIVAKLLKAERFGFEVGPVYLIYRTTRLNKWIESVSMRKKILWRGLWNAGIVVGVGLMAMIIYQLATNLYNLIYRAERALSIQPVIPLPGLTISWESFPYIALALSFVVVTHELAHGIASLADRVPLKSTGIFFAIVLAGGFVEPDDEKLKKAPTQTRLRVFGAGAFMNAALGLVVLLLLVNFQTTISPLYAISSTGAQIVGLTENFPAQTAGMRAGDVIVAINGTAIRNVSELQSYMEKVRPGGVLVVSTLEGKYVLTTQSDPKEPGKARMGVNLSDYMNYERKLSFLPKDLPVYLMRAEFWFMIALLSVALINMLPIYPLDGDKFLEAVLAAVGVRKNKEVRTIASALSLAVLGLNFALSIMKFGFIRI